MGISLKPEHLKRYKDIAWLLMKYGRSDLVKRAGLEEALESSEGAAPAVVPEAEQLACDLEALGEIAEFLDKHTEAGRRYEFQGMLAEFRKSLLRELDYRQEAHNLVTLGANLRSFDRIVVPAPVEDYTTSRVLTMDYIEGQ